MSNSLISISYNDEECKQKALDFAEKNNFSCTTTPEINSTLSLSYTNNLVELKDQEKNISIHIDFLSGGLAHRQRIGRGRGQSISGKHRRPRISQGHQRPSAPDRIAAHGRCVRGECGGIYRSRRLRGGHRWEVDR